MLPMPGSLRSQMSPPCSSRNRFVSASPSPVPSRAPLGRADLLEVVEDPGLVLGRDPDAGVVHLHDGAVGRRSGHHVDHAPGRRELHCVREQVDEHLLDPALVAVGVHRVGGDVDADHEVARLGA